MGMTAQWRLWSGFGTTAMFLIVIAVIGQNESKRISLSEQWVTHTHEVLATLESLTSQLKDAETGQRGYLLTSEESYLKPYLSALSNTPKRLKKLHELIADNPQQLQKLARIRILVDEKLEELDETIQLHRTDSPEAALALVRTSLGMQIMDDIRSLAQEMISSENKLLEERKVTSSKTASSFTWIIYSGSLLTLFIAATVTYLTTKSITNDYTQLLRMENSLRESQVKYEHLAHHDSLTGLPNRRLFLEQLKAAIDHASREKKFVGVMYFDLDDFKRINDSLGHTAGDSLLRKVGARIQEVVRADELMDNIVARVGGDEFIVMLSGLENTTTPALVANRILEALAKPIDVEGNLLLAKTSIGIALYPKDGTTSGQLMRNADTAMYYAKDKGKHSYHFFTNDLNAKLLKRIELEQRLKLAIENSEFVLHYQPQVDTYTGVIVGVESLIRWSEPGNGLVPPNDFIPAAEESGLIVPIGEWVLREACSQAKTWQEMGLPHMTISVNVSARQFRDADLKSSVEQALSISGLESKYLDIELTETAIVEDPEKTKGTLNSLKALGVHVSMDDFGTGYSSLSMLQQLPIDCVKIDQSFVRDIAKSPSDAAITTAIIAMGNSLNMSVVAEGVEDEQQLAFLRKYGCEKIQGYFASKPVEASELTRLLVRGAPLISTDLYELTMTPKKSA